MKHSFQAISENAKKIILSSGGAIFPDAPYQSLQVTFPEGTETGGSDRGGWGNLSIRKWTFPNGQTVIWDSEDRELQAGYPKKAEER